MIELKYQSILTAHNGTIEQEIKTPFGIDFSDVKQILIEFNEKIERRMSIYPNGCIVYFEQTGSQIITKTNWPIEKDDDGDLIIVEPE